MSPSKEVSGMIDMFVGLWAQNKDLNLLEALLHSITQTYPQFLKKFLYQKRDIMDISLFGNLLGSEFVNAQSFDDEILRLTFKIKDYEVVNVDISPKGLSVKGLEIDTYKEVPQKEKVKPLAKLIQFPGPAPEKKY